MITITNAALIISYALGLGPVRVEYTSLAEDLIVTGRAVIAFRDDPKAERTEAQYRNSGYDRGHLAPAADFTSDRETLEATYLTSNISPMVPRFNRGRWARIEDAVRNETRRRGETRIVTIPVYGDTTNRCGRLVVPTAFLKCVYTGDVCIAAWVSDNRNEK